eukprot:4229308-Pyramimonas_sp.AAC.1
MAPDTRKNTPPWGSFGPTFSGRATLEGETNNTQANFLSSARTSWIGTEPLWRCVRRRLQRALRAPGMGLRRPSEKFTRTSEKLHSFC